MFSDKFLNTLEIYVRRDIQYWSKWRPNNEASMWNYDNAFDFWYGHTIGMCTRTVIQIFIDMYDRKPSQLENKAIIDKINEYSGEYKKAFEHLK